ncbi:hypothetical protein scyTo_0012661 [Scyliorhinus torazame]|uniref:Kinetochore-associated protein DSN1 homolog n=1 Tax=Scyliorhinus torazame TaxID=75743 RepID=A0A401NGJ2_SCYTO|nr:hypothetical protein [Scyliorhinus torazame]
MEEGGSVKKRLRNSNQNTSLSQSSSPKRKCIKQQKPGNPEHVAKQEETPPSSSPLTRRSARLNPGRCADASLTPQEHDHANPTCHTKMSPASPSKEPEVSKAPSPNKQAKKSLLSQSWRRSSLKGGKGRKSLPPIHQDSTEICEGIRMDLPEDERLALLLQACLEYTLQKLQRTLETREDFSLEAFQTHVSGISNDVKRVVETMKIDGTLKKCTEKPDDVLPAPETEIMMKQLKDDIARLNAECKAWDRLLDVYQQNINAASDLGKVAVAGETLEPVMMMENSQIDVIKTKPDYRCYFDEDVTILQNMECIMDQLQLTMNLITRDRQEWDSSLQSISEELASRTFKGLEECPLQKFLTVMKE